MNFNERLLNFYINQGLIESKRYDEILDRVTLNKTRVDFEIVKMGLVEPTIAQRYLSDFFGLPFLDFNVLSLDAMVSQNVPMNYIKDNRILPISLTESSVVVAIDNASSFQEALSVKHFYKDKKCNSWFY